MALPKFLFLFLFLFLAPPSAHTAERLLVLLSGDSWVYTRVEQALARSLNPQVRSSLQVTVATAGDTDSAPQPGDSLVVAVGVQAAAQALQSSRPTPVLCVLVPQITFDMLRRVYAGDSGRPVSAIYLDQPMGRQLDLVRLTVPTLQQVGVLLGPNSRMARKTLQAAAHARGISVHIGEIGPDDNPIAALTSVLDDSDALLAEPDPVVFNRGNLEGILLSTYRMSIPVIGFSHAYVQAGALAAVYSTPEQIGRQAGELISRMARLNRWQLPKPSYPAYYTVTVNRQVARSLRLDVPTGQQLQAELEKLERRQ